MATPREVLGESPGRMRESRELPGTPCRALAKGGSYMHDIIQNFTDVRQYVISTIEQNNVVLIITAIGSILWGLVNGFIGYRIFRVLLAVIGCATGAMIGAAVCNALWGIVGAILGALVLAAIGVVIMVFLYLVGLFFYGAGVGVLIGVMILSAFKPEIHPSVLIIPAVLFGILAIFLQKPVIIFSTAFGGSWSVAAGIFHFFGGMKSPLLMTIKGESLAQFKEFHELMLCCWVLLAIICVVVQFRTTKVDVKEVPMAPPPPTRESTAVP